MDWLDELLRKLCPEMAEWTEIEVVAAVVLQYAKQSRAKLRDMTDHVMTLGAEDSEAFAMCLMDAEQANRQLGDAAARILQAGGADGSAN